jgi:hypothetical protein
LVIFKARDYENANHLGQSIIMVGWIKNQLISLQSALLKNTTWCNYLQVQTEFHIEVILIHK